MYRACSWCMASARGCTLLWKTAKQAEGARRGSTARSSARDCTSGAARMQQSKPARQACAPA
jgi:hypothetical protein